MWAFKVIGIKAITGLICRESLEKHINDINRSASGLILTEWKVVSDDKKLEQKAEEARKQLQLYSSGVLSGIELKNTRYRVLVTKKELNNTPEDFTFEDGISYRHIIIATDPDVPSRQAIKK